MKKILIDTNVLLDIGLEREDHNAALAVLLACREEKIGMYMCGTSAKDVFYWMAKAYGADEAYVQMGRLFKFVAVATVDETVCKLGLNYERPDYEDGIVTACALAEHVDAVITRDKRSFGGHAFRKFTPQEFVHELGYRDMKYSIERGWELV